MSLDVMLRRTPIQLEDTRHKFAILDISQRLNSTKFVSFSKSLGLSDGIIDEIKKREEVQEEQFYLVIKHWVLGKEKATFNKLINCLQTCGEDHLVEYILQRLNTKVTDL